MINEHDFIWETIKGQGYIYSVVTKELILVESEVIKMFEKGESNELVYKIDQMRIRARGGGAGGGFICKCCAQ